VTKQQTHIHTHIYFTGVKNVYTYTVISNMRYYSITNKRSPQFREQARFAKSLHPFIVPFSGTSEFGCS